LHPLHRKSKKNLKNNMGGAGILGIILEKTYIGVKKASKLLYNKGGYMKVSDILCISLCIIVSQVTLIYTGGMGVLYQLGSFRKKGRVRIKVKKKIALRYHICTILNPFLIFAI